MPNRSSSGALSLSVMLLAALLLGTTGPAHAAQASIEFTTITLVQPGGPVTTALRALLHLDARYAFGPAVFNLTFDPGILLRADGPQWSWGLTEAYLQSGRGPFELHLGVERLPLETARLMLPFSVEPVDGLGTRLGRLGARLIWYPDTATRIRAGFLDESGTLLPAVSVRRQFPSFEIEGHVLALAGGRTAFGAGGSGLAGNLVVYGEGWTLTAPAESRFALGVSGGLRNGIWMVEAGYAAPQPAAPPRLQLAGQIAYRVSEDLALTGTGRFFADPDAWRGQLVLQLTRTAGNAEYGVSLAVPLGPGPQQGVITTTVSVSF